VRRALVTGATGFIGRRLCLELQRQQVTVCGAGRHPSSGPWTEFVAFDLRDATGVSTVVEGVDTVFHLAGTAHALDGVDRGTEHWEVHAGGTGRLVQAAIAAGVERFVYVSSVKAVGDGGEMLVDERFDALPQTGYGRAKREAERLVLAAGADHGMHVAVLRPVLVYGPEWKGNLERMLRAVRAGRFPPLPDVGNKRSLVHVDDVSRAAHLAAVCAEANGRVYFLTDGEVYSTRRIYEAMLAAVGRQPPGWHVPVLPLRLAARAGDLLARGGIPRVPFGSATLERLTGSAWYDATPAGRELGWEPRHTLEESLPDILGG